MKGTARLLQCYLGCFQALLHAAAQWTSRTRVHSSTQSRCVMQECVCVHHSSAIDPSWHTSPNFCHGSGLALESTRCIFPRQQVSHSRCAAFIRSVWHVHYKCLVCVRDAAPSFSVVIGVNFSSPLKTMTGGHAFLHSVEHGQFWTLPVCSVFCLCKLV